MEITKNIMSCFTYNSPVGKFIIVYDHKISKWALTINGEVCGNYTSPVFAADDVSSQSSSFNEWDDYDIYTTIEDIPTDIYCWNHLLLR